MMVMEHPCGRGMERKCLWRSKAMLLLLELVAEVVAAVSWGQKLEMLKVLHWSEVGAGTA